MITRYILICGLLLLAFLNGLNAQFQLNGSAQQLDDDCYQLTQESDFIAGSIWNLDKISLDQSFEVVMDIFLGCKDGDGADGIVFGFQPISTSIGQAGGFLGFGGVAPSLGIEFDTYQNFDLSDPDYDHLAIIRDGDLNHTLSTNLAGPIQALSDSPNIEDCEWHELRVSWNATTNTLRVFLDCSLRLIYIGDIVNDIFGGDPEVFWGFTAGTGSLNNFQEVCFSYTTFLDELEDVVLCPNGSIQLEATGGVSYEWSPEEGLSNPDISNPIASPESTTTYIVSIFDDCGIPFFDSVTVMVDGDSSFVDLGMDTVICSGDELLLDAQNPNSTYLWNTGDTTALIEVVQEGTYSVTVTVNEYCFDSEKVFVNVVPKPSAELEADDPLCEGSTIFLDVTIDDPDAEYIWHDGFTGPVYEVSGPGTFTVTVSNVCGKATSALSLEYETCREFFMPNVFSPDFDGINDYFFVQDAGDIREVHFLRVFDRWGAMVFERRSFIPNDVLLGWDGTFRGKKANPGVYVWVLSGTFKDGEDFMETGDLILVR